MTGPGDGGPPPVACLTSPNLSSMCVALQLWLVPLEPASILSLEGGQAWVWARAGRALCLTKKAGSRHSPPPSTPAPALPPQCAITAIPVFL